MAAVFELKIVTPHGIAFTGQVRHARIPVENGSVGVLAHHAPYVTSSAGGLLELDEPEGKKQTFRVGPGFFTVERNHASFLTESLQSPSASTRNG